MHARTCDPVEALRRSKIDMINAGFTHPKSWSNIVAFGCMHPRRSKDTIYEYIQLRRKPKSNCERLYSLARNTLLRLHRSNQIEHTRGMNNAMVKSSSNRAYLQHHLRMLQSRADKVFHSVRVAQEEYDNLLQNKHNPQGRKKSNSKHARKIVQALEKLEAAKVVYKQSSQAKALKAFEDQSCLH